MINFIHIAQAATEVTQEIANTEHSSGGVAGTLGLDAGLFIAQLVNFGIVLFILWKFVFKPVADKLQQRTDKIEKSLRDATTLEHEKTDFATWKQQEMAKTRQEASAIISEAEKQALEARQKITEETRLEQNKMVAQTRKQMEQEKAQALQSAKSELADLVTMATEKIIKEKMDEKKDRSLIQEMLKQL
jgi:F-type H+-transporting ATPase subunit b